MTTTAPVKSRPILFSAPMVKAILEGRKTQTRRVIKPQPASHMILDVVLPNGEGPNDPCAAVRFTSHGNGDVSSWGCPHGRPGDLLWVRETWQKSGMGWGNDLPVGKIHYRATDAGEWKSYWGGWKPSIHMPRWASRITLRIESVRVERLQAITEADAIAEGCTAHTSRWWQGFIRHEDGTRSMCEGGADPDGPPPPYYEHPELQTMTTTARDYFQSLWTEINGGRAGCEWHSNPWVWVLVFSRVEPPHA